MLKIAATAVVAFVVGAAVMFEEQTPDVGDHWNVTMTSETMESGEVVDFYNMYRCEGVSTDGDCIQIVCYMYGDKPVGVHHTFWAEDGVASKIPHLAPYAAILATTAEGKQSGFFMSTTFEFEMLTDRIAGGKSIEVGPLHFATDGNTFHTALSTMRSHCGVQ